MSELTLKNKYEIKELELNALLEVTEAINSNVPEESLYKIYNFTLRSNLSIRKLALFVLDEKWNCKVNFGTTTNFFAVELPDYFKTLNGISSLKPNENSEFSEFDIVIPVAHKRNNLAIAFVGGIYADESRYESEDALRFIQALSNIIIEIGRASCRERV